MKLIVKHWNSHWEKVCAASMIGMVVFVAINTHYFNTHGNSSYPLELSTGGS